MNLRVADIQACYEQWSAKGAEFLTPPIDRGAETRCYMRHPDGYVIEVGQATGALHGLLAERRPEDPANDDGSRAVPMATTWPIVTARERRRARLTSQQPNRPALSQARASRQ